MKLKYKPKIDEHIFHRDYVRRRVLEIKLARDDAEVKLPDTPLPSKYERPKRIKYSAGLYNLMRQILP